MKTLYERLGGQDAISAVVDELFARKVADKQLGRFFVGHGTDAKKRIKQDVANFLCMATGGPQFYTGRDMKTIHTGLNMTDSDWQIATQLIIEVLAKFNAPPKEKEEVLAAVSSLKKDIVGI